MSSGILPTGFKRKRLDEIKDDLEALFKSVYGNNLNVSAESPNGQIIGLLAGSFSDLWEIAEGAYNAYNPSAATDQALSNLVQLNLITRNEATASVAELVFTGTSGVTIPAGTVVSHNVSQAQFATVEPVTIINGTALVNAEATVTGAIEAIAGTLTELDNPITGVSQVTNLEDANVGSERETDTELKVRREQSLALNSQSTIDSIFSAIINLDFVTQVTVLENDTDTTDANGLPPHSFQAIVVDGLAEDIVNAIWLNKPAGINAFGNVTETVFDSQGIPHPISFSRPNEIPVYVVVNITRFSNYPVDGDEQIKQAIVDYANGDLIEQRGFGLGDDVIYSQLYTPVNTVFGHQVDSLFIGTGSNSTGTSNIPVAVNEISVFTVDNIVVN